jgi:hypothetical protein
MSDQIYVPLLDEGINVWRPAPAHKIDPSTYIVLRPDNYDANDEHWEFPPGSVVVCETRPIDKRPVLVAVRRIQPGRQTA